MTDLVVVGNGVAGSSVARAARERGLSVLVVGNGAPAASSAALCVVRPAWLPREARPDVAAAVAAYEAVGAIVAATADVSSWVNPEPETRGGWWAVDPARWTVPLDEAATWPEVPEARATVVCLGAAGDRAGTRRWGATAVHRAVTLTGPIVRAHASRPRRVETAVRVGRTWRVGSTVAPTEAVAVDRLGALVAASPVLDRLGDPLDVVTGLRLYADDGSRLRRRLGPTTWALDGFGRLGFSLAPAAARFLVDEVAETIAR